MHRWRSIVPRRRVVLNPRRARIVFALGRVVRVTRASGMSITALSHGVLVVVLTFDVCAML